MTTFKQTTVSTLPAIIEPLSESAKFWKNNVNPATVYRELNAINWIDINVQNQILTTSATKVSLYDPESSEKKRTFQSPNHTLLYGGNFRRENQKIFATGAADGIVRIWECKKSKPLRLLGNCDNVQSMKHSAPIHRVNFNGLNQLFSCGDDKQIKLWDFIEEKILFNFNGDCSSAHDDYIRASCSIEIASLFVSGSYDHTVKIWDSRSPQTACYQYGHKHAIESVTNRDLLVISASDTTIQVFDVVAGKTLRTLDNVHHKTITCVHNYGTYLLTASIDGHLKIFDFNFNVIASFSYTPSQLLSCYYNGSYLAVGTNNGILSINKIAPQSKTTRGRSTHYGGDKVAKHDDADNEEEMADEFLFNNIPKRKTKVKLDKKNMFIVPKVAASSGNQPRQEKQEELLRKFKYTAALNRVMRKFAQNDSDKVVNFMQELIRRNGLRSALAGRNVPDLKRIIKFIITNLSDIRFSRILLDVSLILVNIYANDIKHIAKVRTLFKELNQRVDDEIDNLQKMSEISGQLQFLINSQIK
ncbi:U3 small nucleolar RNA-associated protein 15-like protein [Euroglyphus maynei]|uniref:U3 small nucleolar RNA-associated protein 15 homolog n=1 Tax=Euroglyphus maynei TaxID=6958 RepID=A0A1Y3BAV1_EURMA|nr:U3 small nucleolar RNA-associated protein 15-like protein [Euroglyphus maynei]